MPFPAGVEVVTLTGGTSGYRTPDGTAYAGTIKLTPSVSRVTSATHGIITLGTVNATLNASGGFSATLLATNAAGFSPSGWTYRVDEEFTNAPGRAYDISLPAAVPAAALPALSPVSSTSGTVSAAAVLSVNGETGVVTIDAADVGAAPTSRQIIAGTGLTGGGTLAADRTLTVSFGTTGTTVCVGNDTRLSDARTPTVHASSHGSGGSDPITITQSQVTGLTVALSEKAPLAGATFTGAVAVSGADFSVVSTTKGYRFRRGGGALDLEGTGADLIVSVWSGTAFDGTQRSYDRYAADALAAQHAGKREFVSALYGAVVHTIDPAANQLGFHGNTPVSRQSITGSRGGNAALASLLTALAALGLITDNTSA